MDRLWLFGDDMLYVSLFFLLSGREVGPDILLLQYYEQLSTLVLGLWNPRQHVSRCVGLCTWWCIDCGMYNAIQIDTHCYTANWNGMLSTRISGNTSIFYVSLAYAYWHIGISSLSSVSPVCLSMCILVCLSASLYCCSLLKQLITK